jgi:hypothetical protein
LPIDRAVLALRDRQRQQVRLIGRLERQAPSDALRTAAGSVA